jgi:hypothetical protein
MGIMVRKQSMKVVLVDAERFRLGKVAVPVMAVDQEFPAVIANPTDTKGNQHEGLWILSDDSGRLAEYARTVAPPAVRGGASN